MNGALQVIWQIVKAVVVGLGSVGTATYVSRQSDNDNRSSGRKHHYSKYGRKWMQNLSNEEWETEREIVRQQYVKEQDPHKFDQKEQLLQSFDR